MLAIPIEEGDILAEIETDKATMEFESFNEGTLLYIGLKEGESANVDDLLAIIGPAGTDVSGVAANFSTGTKTDVEAAPQETPKVSSNGTQRNSKSRNCDCSYTRSRSDNI